jgi:uncharacterized protein YdaU (DUF1376 family)
MPTFEFDLETFTTVAIEASTEEKATEALGLILDALGRTEYVVGPGRRVASDGAARNPGGRPADVRRQLGRMLQLREKGWSNVRIARELRVARSSVQRALKWARERGA